MIKYQYGKRFEFDDVVGMVFSSVYHDDVDVYFHIQGSADRLLMTHDQDCCESVTLEEVIGDLEDLVGTPILEARESASENRFDAEYEILGPEEQVMFKLSMDLRQTDDDMNSESQTWTFYNFRTIKGSVTLRWYGTSNGYYSEAVTLKLITAQ